MGYGVARQIGKIKTAELGGMEGSVRVGLVELEGISGSRRDSALRGGICIRWKPSLLEFADIYGRVADSQGVFCKNDMACFLIYKKSRDRRVRICKVICDVVM